MSTSDNGQQDIPTTEDVESTGYPERLDEISTSLSDLYQALDGQENLDTVLYRLADTTVRAVPDADLVSITVMADGQLQTAAATDSRTSTLDQQQRDNAAGPYLAAIEQRSPLRAGLTDTTRDRWPDFSAASETAGIGASLSAPVFIDSDSEHYTQDDNRELLGMLNLYSESSGAFDPFDQALLRLLTTTVSAAISSARRQTRFRELTDQLHYALQSRGPIEQAKGVLIAIHGINADTAFQRLVQESQRTHTKLHTIAERLLDSL